MRSEKEMMDLILTVAQKDDRIRAVYMNGSRANPKVERDIYQDYDIVYVVTETKSFIKDKTWINVFGDIAIVQEPDLIDLAFGKECDFSSSYAWLMLFKDSNRIDLTIQTIEKTKKVYLDDKLTIPLLDKDNILPEIPLPTDEDYWVKKPTPSQFAGCCNEFWWCLNNVGKGIARDELPYTMQMYNVYVREMLIKMLEWYIGVNTDFSVSSGKMGKFFKKYLPKDIYEMYLKTYSDCNYDNLWAAVFNACQLFRGAAIYVSTHLGYTYNQSEDDNIMDYLKRIKNNC